MNWSAPFIMVTCCCGLLAACGRDTAGDDDLPPAGGQVVARNGDVVVTTEMVSAYLGGADQHRQRLFARSREERARVVQELVRQEALYAEAVAAGVHRRADVARRWKAIVVNAHLADLERESAGAPHVSEQEIESELRRLEAGGEERVRVSRVTFESRAAARAAAARLRGIPGADRYGELLRLARERGESAALPGDLGWLARGDPKHPREIVAAAFALDALWAVSDPVRVGSGWSVLVKTGARKPPAANARLREAVRTRLARGKQAALLRQRIRAVLDPRETEIRHDLLERLETTRQGQLALHE